MSMNLIAEGNAIVCPYKIYALTGVVEGTTTRSQTEVTGQIGGGGNYGTAYTQPVTGSVQSKTTVFHDIYLKEDDGTEHAINLINFQVPCKDGQRLTMYAVKKGMGSDGTYFYGYNHNTRQSYESGKPLRDAMYPFLGLAAVVVGGFLIAFFSDLHVGMGDAIAAALLSALALAIVGGIAGLVVAFVRSQMVLATGEFKKHMQAMRTQTGTQAKAA